MQVIAQHPAEFSRIVLIGFMGAGKSTVGSLLAPHLGWRFQDADVVLEQQAGQTIAEIFSGRGEAAFRRMEADVIRALLREENLVLAVGGGAIETEVTREAIFSAPKTCVVFLEAPLETMVARCEQQAGAAVRPVLQDRDRLEARFAARLPYYRQAHLVVETAARSPEETARHIMESLNLFSEEGRPA